MNEEAADTARLVEIEIPDIAATEALAQRLAPLLRSGDIVTLSGDLGAGKTAFSRALIRTLSQPDTEVPSPTFTLVQTYDVSGFEIWHFDLYRLGTPEDAFELDIEEAFATGVSLIEWPERLGNYMPQTRLEIRFSFGDTSSSRHVKITGIGGWAARLAAFKNV